MAKINFARLAASNSDDAFIEAVASIKRRSETLQLDIHLYLVAVAARWAKSGDVRPAVKMVNLLLAEMPAGVRSNAIRIWVEKHLGFVFNTEAKEFVDGKVKAKDLVIKDLANARWWEETPEPEYKGLDFTGAVLSLIKKANDRLKTPNDADKIEVATLRAVQFAANGKSLGFAEIMDVVHGLDPADLAKLRAAITPEVQQSVAA